MTSPAAVTSPVRIFQTTAQFPPLSDRFEAYNRQHSALKRVSVRYFELTLPGIDAELIDAGTIRLFADYSVALCTLNDLPTRVPAYYTNFAENMNAHDDSGYGWPYVDDTTGTIVWNDAHTPADPTSFCVLDHEISEHYLPEGEVAVSQLYYDNAERLHKLEQRREIRYYNNRQEKKKLKADSVAEVHTKEAKELFAKKRKALEDAAATTAAKKQKGTGDEMET